MTYSASTHTFIRHTVDYPPPGDGWELAFVVATTSGGGSYEPSVYDRYQQVRTGSVSSNVVGIWARQRTEEDFEREAENLLNDQGGGWRAIGDTADLKHYGTLGDRAMAIDAQRNARLERQRQEMLLEAEQQ
jgi:hypothetical protein